MQAYQQEAVQQLSSPAPLVAALTAESTWARHSAADTGGGNIRGERFANAHGTGRETPDFLTSTSINLLDTRFFLVFTGAVSNKNPWMCSRLNGSEDGIPGRPTTHLFASVFVSTATVATLTTAYVVLPHLIVPTGLSFEECAPEKGTSLSRTANVVIKGKHTLRYAVDTRRALVLSPVPATRLEFVTGLHIAALPEAFRLVLI